MLSALLKYIVIQALTTQNVVYGVILGIVQGVSEWLPISSKTQILFVSTYLLHMSFQQAYSFGLFMEIGTILAAVIYFRKELLVLINVLLGKGNPESKLLFKFVVISTIATAIVAVPIYLVISSLQNAYNLGIPMLFIGLVLIADALIIRYSRSKYSEQSNRKGLAQMSTLDYIIVGVAQGIAALPGVSRSGITTSTMLLMNVDTGETFRLSFLDMIFATTGAVLLTLIQAHSAISSSIALIGVSGLIIAIIVATIISLFLIDFLLKIAKKSSIIYLTGALGIIAVLGGIAILFSL